MPLSIQYRGPGKILLGRIEYKEAGSVLHGRNDLPAHFLWNGRAAERRSHHSIFIEDSSAHIRSAMYDNIPFTGKVVEPFIHPLYPQGKSVAAIIGLPGHI